jgi:hypothetical protein
VEQQLYDQINLFLDHYSDRKSGVVNGAYGPCTVITEVLKTTTLSARASYGNACPSISGSTGQERWRCEHADRTALIYNGLRAPDIVVLRF